MYNIHFSGLKLAAFGVLATMTLGGCAMTAKQAPLPATAVATPAPAIMDSDGDGVPDDMDACPGTPPGATVDHKGCEIVGKLENAHFQFDSAALTNDAKVVMDRIVSMIRQFPDRKFEVAGHTDAMGSDEYNSRLGERRAIAVVEYFTRSGIPSGQLVVHTYGESNPIADNDSETGRAMNRRVEIVATDM